MEETKIFIEQAKNNALGILKSGNWKLALIVFFYLMYKNSLTKNHKALDFTLGLNNIEAVKKYIENFMEE